MSTSAHGAAPFLECLGVVATPCGTTVHVKAPGQMFGLSLERALYCIEEFREHDQGYVLAMLPFIYAIPEAIVMCVTAHERHLIRWLTARTAPAACIRRS